VEDFIKLEDDKRSFWMPGAVSPQPAKGAQTWMCSSPTFTFLS